MTVGHYTHGRMSECTELDRRMMTAASPITTCDLSTTAPGSYTTPGTGRNSPPQGNINAYVSQHLPSQVSDFNKPSTSPSPLTSKGSNGTDSGYASFAPTPDKGTLAQKLFKRTPKKLSIFEKDVPDPVNNRFHDLHVLFNEPLYRYLGKHGVAVTAMSIKLKYAGESEAAAKPWIIVQCDERASKRVRRFFNQQQIKAQYQPRDAQSPDVNFGLLVRGIPPKQMATESEHYIRGDISDGAPTLCGKPIKICTSNGTRLATLGGLIKVVNSDGIQLYGMTAGHIITRKEFDKDGVDHDDDDTYGKQSTEGRFSTVKSASVAGATEDIATDEASMTDDQSCSGDKDVDDHDESSEQGEDEEEYELDFGSVDDQQGKSNINPAALSRCLQRNDLLKVRWPKLGHLSFVSHQPASDSDLDWALIKFHDPTLCRPNLLTFPEHTYEFGVSARLREGPRRLTRATRSRDVLLLSGMAGLKRGKLATSFGYLMIGPVKQFKEIYSVSMSDGSVLDAGDCGSWVVDSVTHEVYGHVVASDAFGDAYVIPLDNTFRDIRQQLAADQVCLPTESEVLDWIKPSGNIQAPKNHTFLSLCADNAMPNHREDLGLGFDCGMGSFAPTIPECYGDLRLDFKHEIATSAAESEESYERLKATDGGPFESYNLMSGTLDEYWGTPFESDDCMAPLSNIWTPGIHSKSTAIPDIASVADMAPLSNIWTPGIHSKSTAIPDIASVADMAPLSNIWTPGIHSKSTAIPDIASVADMAPLSNIWTPGIHSKSTAVPDIASVADTSLLVSLPDSGYSSTSSSPLSHAEETGAVSSTASGQATNSQK